MHVGLAKDNRARLTQLGDHEGIRRRQHSGKRRRASCGRQIGGIVIVFQHQRHTMQRSYGCPSRPFGIEPIRFRESPWIKGHNGIKCWTFTIICCNPIEIGLDDLAARPDVGLQRLLNAGDRCLLNDKVLSCRLACN
jgi:hypothetical protein